MFGEAAIFCIIWIVLGLCRLEHPALSFIGGSLLEEVIPRIGTSGFRPIMPSFFRLAHLWLRHIAAALLLSTILGLVGVGEVAGMDCRVRDAHVVHRRLRPKEVGGL